MGQQGRKKGEAIRLLERQLTLAFMTERLLPADIEETLAKMMDIPDVPGRGEQVGERQ